MPTPLEKLTTDWQTHYSDMPLSDFVTKVHAKMYSDIPFSDFTDKLGLTVPPTPPDNTPPPSSDVMGASPWQGGETPAPKEAFKAMESTVRAGLQMGGQAAGGAGGALLGSVPGAIAGETAGYVAGDYAGDLLYGGTDKSLAQRAGEGLAFSVVPRGLIAGAEYLGKGAVRSALKIPPTLANEKTAKSAVDTIIKNNMRVGDSGVAKGKEIVRGIEDDLNRVLSSSNSMVQVKDVVYVMESQKARFANSSDPAMANGIIDRVIAKFMNHPNVEGLQIASVGKGVPVPVAGEIPIAKAQLMKKELYRELDAFYKNAQSLTPKMAAATNRESVALASEAEGLRKSIMSDPSVPREAADWLKQEGEVMNALRWIKRRANTAANMDPITFNDVMLGGLLRQGVPYAVAVRIGRMPSVLSQIGIGMAKSGPLRQPLQAGAIATKGLLTQ